MPVCAFYTNLAHTKVPAEFALLLTRVIADALSKPVERITVNIMPDQNMIRGGSSEPTCWMNLWAIDVFNAGNNPKFASKLYPVINEKLGITNERIVLLFHDIKPEQVAKPQ